MENFSIKRLSEMAARMAALGLLTIALMNCSGVDADSTTQELPGICVNQESPVDRRSCSFDTLPYEIDNQVAAATARAETLEAQPHPSQTPEAFTAVCAYIGNNGSVSRAYDRLAPNFRGNPTNLRVFKDPDGDGENDPFSYDLDNPKSWPRLVHPEDVVCLTDSPSYPVDPAPFLNP